MTVEIRAHLWDISSNLAPYVQTNSHDPPWFGVIRLRYGDVIPARGESMEERFLRPRERQVVELLLQGCDNDEISKQLNMARRTVKAHFNRLFTRFGIHGGVKRV